MRPLHPQGRNACGGRRRDGFLASRGMRGTRRGRNRAIRRCSKGSSGEAIPCQPQPLQRQPGARVTPEHGRLWLFSDLPNRRNDYGLIEHTSWCRNRSCTPYHGNENADFRRLEPGSAKSGCQASAPTGETLRQGPIRNHRRAQAFVTDRRQAQALTVAPPSFRLNLTGPAPSGTCRAGLPEMTSIGEQPPIASRMPSRSRPRR